MTEQVQNSDQKKYDHKSVEAFWQRVWGQNKLDVTDLSRASRPFYNLMMFPYPSAEGLHVGNMYAFTGSDIYGRYKRMQGFDVFEPIGLDGFGIHSENYALKIGRHPMDHASITEKRFYEQLHQIGAMYDWTRTVETYDPDYYRWTQWIFVQMFKHGLAYRGKASVNWCPSCKTVLADEQVLAKKASIPRPAADGTRDLNEDLRTLQPETFGTVPVCERCGNIVEKRLLEQWFFRITAYAEKLLENIPKLNWTEKVKVAQEQWIGKKAGITITYPVADKDGRELSTVDCFTTRPDTNFGATFVVVAPEYKIVEDILNGKIPVGQETARQIKEYTEEVMSKSSQDRIAGGRKKTGVFTGLYCVNQLNNYKMPLYISDFVLMSFGTGAVVGVPGHDKRDFEFAQTFDIPIKRVVIAADGDTSTITKIEQVQEEEGTMVNSGFLDGLDIHEAIKKMMDYLEEKRWGKRVTTYHLRDWLISRQRYWGPPIPMVFCSSCAQSGHSWFTSKEVQGLAQNLEPGARGQEFRAHGQSMAGWYPVPEDQLPVVLPRIEDYKPGDDGVAPLAKHKEFYETKCPRCGRKAVRETDVSDTFLDSSWYFLRYPSVKLDQSDKLDKFEAKQILPWDPRLTRKWLPVAMYTGGAEHSVLHLMYSRFIWMVLYDLGYFNFSAKGGPASGWDEPFPDFYAHGLVIKDGAKMSKSRGNVVNPDDYIKAYGADSLRLYLMFIGPFSQGGDFRDTGMEGMSRWLGRVWKIAIESITKSDQFDKLDQSKDKIVRALHKLIKKVGEDIEKRRYNTAIAAMMEFTNLVQKNGGRLDKKTLRDFILILAPFAPHLSEEIYQRLGESTHFERVINMKQVAKSAQTETKKSSKKGSSESPEAGGVFDSVHTQKWPVFNPTFVEEEEVEIVVQVDGKLRDRVVVEKGIAASRLEVESIAKARERVGKFLNSKKVKKVIFVPQRLINFVTG